MSAAPPDATPQRGGDRGRRGAPRSSAPLARPTGPARGRGGGGRRPIEGFVGPGRRCLRGLLGGPQAVAQTRNVARNGADPLLEPAYGVLACDAGRPLVELSQAGLQGGVAGAALALPIVVGEIRRPSPDHAADDARREEGGE